MKRRQDIQRQDMVELDGQHAHLIEAPLIFDDRVERLSQVELTQLMFDLHLPRADDA